MPSFSWSELFPGWYSWEFLGVVTGIFSVLLLIFVSQKSLQWTNWPFSVVSATVYTYLFYIWGLFGNMALQPLFVIISLWGGWKWRGQLPWSNVSVKEVPTRFALKHIWFFVTVIGLALMAIVYPVLGHYNDPSPLLDGLIFCISLSAVYLQLKKYVQSWYLWIIVDLIAIPFHFSQDRGATALLYAAYLGMCFFGLYTWWKEAKENRRQDIYGLIGEIPVTYEPVTEYV